MASKTLLIISVVLLFFSKTTWAAERNGDPFIVRFKLNEQGALHIIFSNSKDITIPKEQGRHNDGSLPTPIVYTQQTFDDIHIGEYLRMIGWLPSYMMCAQSYPCTPELAIFDVAHGVRYISAPHGIVSDWKLIHQDTQIVINFAYPHGELGNYALYDAESLEKLAEFDGSQIPDWVQDYQSRIIGSLYSEIDKCARQKNEANIAN